MRYGLLRRDGGLNGNNHVSLPEEEEEVGPKKERTESNRGERKKKRITNSWTLTREEV